MSSRQHRSRSRHSHRRPRERSHQRSESSQALQSPEYQPQPQPQPRLKSSRRSRHNTSSSNNNYQYTPVDTGHEHGIARRIATGEVGLNYGPYNFRPGEYRFSGEYDEPPPEPQPPLGHQQRLRRTRAPINAAEVAPVGVAAAAAPDYFADNPAQKPLPPQPQPPPAVTPNSATVPQYIWDTKEGKDEKDPYHDVDPVRDKALVSDFDPFSIRGWSNGLALLAIGGGLLGLFLAYPVIVHFAHPGGPTRGFNLGGINGSGQVPTFSSFPSLIDADTPDDALSRKGFDGKTYDLVFSDEFNLEGRSFYPGDDPYWEAADMWYGSTNDLEWYDPKAVTTHDGKLVITISKELNHDLNFTSAMLTTWNKMCFTTGYVEVSMSLPGDSQISGLWPGAWSLGNLARAGYGATTQGTWPYSYDACDIGTFPNQTWWDQTPSAAMTGGLGGDPISLQPGQRLSACTCPGSDHPGPTTSKGRGAPEIDIIEARIDLTKSEGLASQSLQLAPFNMQYEFVNTTPASTIYDTSITTINDYHGGPYQQAVSTLSVLDPGNYGGYGYTTYGYEYFADPDNRDEGYVTFVSQGKQTWTVRASALGPDSSTLISQRPIPEEPMYLILNLAMSQDFQLVELDKLKFPAQMFVDYVRVYQRRGTRNGVTCNPPDYPTTDYINNHINAYTNANLTTWENAGYTFPRNSQYDGC